MRDLSLRHKYVAETPESCKEHQSKYKENAWEAYTLLELGTWVQLLTKRASHRKPGEKQEKDLQDASNYLDMMRAKFEAERERILNPEPKPV